MPSKFFTFILILLMPILSFGQDNIQDTEAGKILEKVAAQFQSLTALQTDFELSIVDRKENTSKSSTGNLILKQQKYKLTSEGSTVYFDGKTMWTYIKSGNEVTITEPESNSTDFMSNPSSFFTSYKNDFKYRYVRETNKNGVLCDEIDLFPKNLNQPYSRIKVFVNKQTNLPEMITSVGKDGVDYSVALKNKITNKDFPDTFFTFDPAQNKRVEIVDMRGL